MQDQRHGELDKINYNPLITNNVNKNIFNNVINVNKTIEDKQRTAAYLAEKFNDYGSINFYLKVAWKIDRGKIDRMVGDAFEMGNAPVRYFTHCAKIAMSK